MAMTRNRRPDAAIREVPLNPRLRAARTGLPPVSALGPRQTRRASLLLVLVMLGVTGLADPAAAATARAVAGGGTHTCALTTSGGVKCWGENANGQVGDGTTTTRGTPTDVIGLTSGVAAVAAGGHHTCALTTSGGLKCWGWNSYGQLGDGTTTDRTAPTDVDGLTSGVAAVAAGYGHTCALTMEGGLQCWGWNYSGQLGDGTTTDRMTPTDVIGLTSGVAAGTAGWSHTCALTTGSGLKCWGDNTAGQLGDGTTTTRPAPTDVAGLTSAVAAVTTGYGHTCARTTGSGVKCWGWNSYGQLGHPHADTVQQTPIRLRGFGSLDFDDDAQVDVAVYRPAAGTWFSLDSTTAGTTYRSRGWGMEAHSDTPVVGDFDGDGMIDPAVYRPATGTWFVLESHANFATWIWFGWGEATDTPVPGDYDGDGITDAAVYRPSTGTWYVRPTTGAQPWNVVFGEAADVPVAGDFDGDGAADLAGYRPATGTWFVLTSSSGFTSWWFHGWGVQAEGDTPAPGDYDGDGKTDLCVFRPGPGTWFILESHAAYTTASWFGWGEATDTPVPADFDADGRTDGAIYRAGTWYIRPSSGAPQWSVVFGQAGDRPLVVGR
jgi:hypothetical protein